MGDFLIPIKKVIYFNEPSLEIDYCDDYDALLIP
jgi:hypothetical protein